MTIFQGKPIEAIPGGNRRERVSNDRKKLEMFYQRFEQSGKRGRVLDHERKIRRERLVNFDKTVFSPSLSLALTNGFRRIIANLPANMF